MTDFPFAIAGFDLDGTLFDTHADLGHAVNHALALAGRPVRPIASMRALIGGGARAMLMRALAEDGVSLPDEEFAAIFAQLLVQYEANIAVHTQPFPGALEALDDLAARGTRLALVTNKPQHLAQKLVDELGLSSRFACLIGAGAGHPLKPAPDALNAMVANLGGGRAVYVGDTAADVNAAKAAGIPSVAVSFGFCPVPACDLGADAVINHFDDLLPTLDRL